jgi:hypothetical protein
VERIATLEQIREETVAPQRLNALLVGAFGAVALAIAAVGIGGTLAFFIARRTAEIGIRMSLGADSRRVMGMVLGAGGAAFGYWLGAGAGGVGGAGAGDPWEAVRSAGGGSGNVPRRGRAGADSGARGVRGAGDARGAGGSAGRDASGVAAIDVTRSSLPAGRPGCWCCRDCRRYWCRRRGPRSAR